MPVSERYTSGMAPFATVLTAGRAASGRALARMEANSCRVKVAFMLAGAEVMIFWLMA